MSNVENYCYLFRFVVQIEKESFTYQKNFNPSNAMGIFACDYAMEFLTPS